MDFVATAITAVAVSIVVAFSIFPPLAVSGTLIFRQLHFPPGKPSGYSVAVAPGGVLFAGVRDGLILQYFPSIGWRTFAYISPTRTNAACDSSTDPNLWPLCGFPAGVAHDMLTGQVYIAGGYQGLVAAGPEPGKLATPLATVAGDGIPFKATIGVEFNPMNKNMVYFTDTSTNYNISVWKLGIRAGDMSGRLMQYNTNTRQVTVLRSGLGWPTGVATSADCSFLLVSESSVKRITRVWLTGPLAGTSEPFITNIALPANIKRTVDGEFLIAAHTVDAASEKLVPIAVRADATGRIVETTSLGEEYENVIVTEVNQPLVFKTYISSHYTPYIGIFYGPI